MASLNNDEFRPGIILNSGLSNQDLYRLSRIYGLPSEAILVASVGKAPTTIFVGLDGNYKEAKGEVTLKFVVIVGMNRRRVFPLKVGRAETVTIIKEKLAAELETAWQPVATKSGDIYISDGRKVLSHDFCPAQGVQNGKEYMIHILPAGERFIQMELEIESDSRVWAGVIFALENATVEDLCEQISIICSYPRPTVTIYVNTRKPNEEEEDEEVHHSCDEEDAVDNEFGKGPMREADSSSRKSFEPLSLPPDAIIKDHPEIFHHGCLLKVKHSTSLTLPVKVTFDASREVFEFMLDIKRTDSTNLAYVHQAIAKEMGTDGRRLIFCHEPNRSIRFRGWTNGGHLEVKLRTKAAEVLIAHVDGAFEYQYFIQDTTETTVGEVEREVEKRHSFRQGCVQLYLNNRLLNSDLTLRDAGVEMDSRLTVHTRCPGSINRNAEYDSTSSANTSEACEQREKRHTRKTSTASDSDVGRPVGSLWRNPSSTLAKVGDSEETVVTTPQNVGSRIITGGKQQCKSTPSDTVPNASNAADASESQTAVLSVQNGNQKQALQKQLQRLTDYENQVAVMARALSGSRQDLSTPVPDDITTSQEPASTKTESLEAVTKLLNSETASQSRDHFVGPHPAFPPDPVQLLRRRPQGPAVGSASRCMAVASRPPMEMARYNPAPAARRGPAGNQGLQSYVANQYRLCEQSDNSYVITTSQRTKIQLPRHLSTEQQRQLVTHIADAQSGRNTQPQQTSQMVAIARPKDALDKAIDCLARRMGANDWHMFSFSLGLSMKDLEDIETEHPRDMFLQIVKGLNRWRQAEGNKATMQVLISKLNDNKRCDLANELTVDAP